MCASVLLLPAFFLRAGTEPKRQFDLSGPPRATSATWLTPDRIIGEAPAATARSLPVPTTLPAAARRDATTRPSAVDTTTEPALASVGTPTSAKPVPATTTTVRAAPLRPAPTTTAPGVLVTLPNLLTPVAPAAKAVSGLSERGKASWFHAPDATCAHRSLPRGTIVKVTRVSTGAWTTCEIGDWGPADTSRVIDLSFDTFEQLASADEGVIDVVVEW